MKTSIFVRAQRAGMTLVEIMVVIAIIGILTTALAVGVTGYLEESRVETTKIQMGQIMQALETYGALHRGKYPSTADGLTAVKDKFQGDIPKDAWNNDYIYRSPGGDGRPYELMSLGSDGKEGGEEKAADIKSWDLD